MGGVRAQAIGVPAVLARPRPSGPKIPSMSILSRKASSRTFRNPGATAGFATRTMVECQKGRHGYVTVCTFSRLGYPKLKVVCQNGNSMAARSSAEKDSRHIT